MPFVKWTDKHLGKAELVIYPIRRGLYNEGDDTFIPWSGTKTAYQMNYFIWDKKQDDWKTPGTNFNEKHSNWSRPVYNGNFREQELKDKCKTDNKCTK